MNAADLIVMAPDRPGVTLLVEVKVGAVDMLQVEKAIKEYMLLRRCGLRGYDFVHSGYAPPG